MKFDRGLLGFRQDELQLTVIQSTASTQLATCNLVYFLPLYLNAQLLGKTQLLNIQKQISTEITESRLACVTPVVLLSGPWRCYSCACLHA